MSKLLILKSNRHFVLRSFGVLFAMCLLIGCQGESGQPNGRDLTFYGRILLGEDRTDQDLVVDFIVQDRDIFWDRNRDGVPQADELLDNQHVFEITSESTGQTFQIKELRLARAAMLVSESSPQQLGMTVTSDSITGFEQVGSLKLSTDPTETDWLHFFGPLEFIFDDYDDGWTVGGEAEIRINVGSFAKGDAKSLGVDKTQADPSDDAEITQEISSDRQTHRLAILVPSSEAIYPEVEITFPTEDDPLVTKKTLDKACCGDSFGSKVLIPENAIEGTAKVRFTFNRWQGESISPIESEVILVGTK